MPEPAFPDNPFWDFSLAVYGRPGVADACLALQDRHGLDVNLLLLSCWAGSQGRALDTAALSRLMAAAAGWQREVVRPLRGVRHWLKAQAADAANPAPAADASGPAAALRAAVKAQELEAERIEQLLLFEALGPPAAEGKAGAPAPTVAAANLRVYLALAGVTPDDGDSAALAARLAGACEGLMEDEAAKLLA
jgi:uncharacterized protein (TIGR02444 family)